MHMYKYIIDITTRDACSHIVNINVCIMFAPRHTTIREYR